MKKSKFLFGITALLASMVMMGCDMELRNEDERLAENDSLVITKVKDSTAISSVKGIDGLTLAFHTSGNVENDQAILFSGTSNSKAVSIRTGYLGDWATWDSGINDALATGGTLVGSNGETGTAWNVMKNGFTGDDYCVFAFKKASSTTSDVYYYINGDLALYWKGATSTFSAAVIDALATGGLKFGDLIEGTVLMAPKFTSNKEVTELYNAIQNAN